MPIPSVKLCETDSGSRLGIVIHVHHGVCLSTIKNHMRSLRIRGWPEHPLSDFEVHKIYKDIDTFIQDKASAKKVLYLLPECREGVGLLAHGLFYDDDAV